MWLLDIKMASREVYARHQLSKLNILSVKTLEELITKNKNLYKYINFL